MYIYITTWFLDMLSDFSASLCPICRLETSNLLQHIVDCHPLNFQVGWWIQDLGRRGTVCEIRLARNSLWNLAFSNHPYSLWIRNLFSQFLLKMIWSLSRTRPSRVKESFRLTSPSLSSPLPTPFTRQRTFPFLLTKKCRRKSRSSVAKLWMITPPICRLIFRQDGPLFEMGMTPRHFSYCVSNPGKTKQTKNWTHASRYQNTCHTM